MLLGSLRALDGSGFPAVTSTAAIFGRSTVRASAPGLAAPGFRSSTAALGCCSSGVVWQPAARSRLVALRTVMRIARIGFLLSIDERTPRRLAHVAAGVRQVLTDAAIRGYRREHPAPASYRGEQDHPAVRGEARRLVAVAIGDDLHLLVRQIQQRHLELAGFAGHIS